MTVPDFPTFKRLAKRGNLIALSKTIPADLETPVSCFLKLAAREPHAFLLESAEQEESIGRYSFLGLAPEMILESRNHVIRVTERGRRKRLARDERILEVMQKIMRRFKLANPEGLPRFCGGFVGYLAYENVEDFEAIRLKRRKGPEFPESVFFLCQNLVLIDHYRKTLSVISLVPTEGTSDLKALYRDAQLRIETHVRRLRMPLPATRGGAALPKASHRLKSNMSRRAFESKVRRIKEYIRAGDCIQVVLAQRFELPLRRDDFQIYRALRSINPSPYMFYFRAGTKRLIGSSPEVLIRKTDREVEIRPIAGTRPRGRDGREDAAYAEGLKRSPKEMAEHLMLVDLGRNDLGRVCEFDTIRVRHFARIERFSHVMHLVSDVAGRLRRGVDAFEALKAAFPAGTVTGAPKIRAMQIINELEPEKRGPYAGCLGYFSFNQDMDMCITIRTLAIDGRHAHLQAGAGIVKDSEPKREYCETINKAKAVLKAVSERWEFE